MRRNAKVQIRKIDDEIARLAKLHANCPDGRIWIIRNGHSFKYFQKFEGCPPVYLGKKQRQLARDLAYKKYLELKMQDLKAERDALLWYDEHFSARNDRAAKYLMENEGAGLLLRDCFPIAQAPLSAWAARPECREAKNQDERNVKCMSGHMVRTKSEASIANALFVACIPFRYEDPLALGTETFFPDFTIRHPKTGEYLYWEHFGMVDNLKYRKRWINALNQYAACGYYPYVNLIATTETNDVPLDAGQIKMMMEYYFSK